MGKVFSWRAASTIEEWSRARACRLVQLHAIKEIALAQYFAICPCNVVAQVATTVMSLKKKGHRLFEDDKCVIGGYRTLCHIFRLKNGRLPFFKDTVAFAPCQSPCPIYFNMAKFQKVFTGRTECSRGPHAARGP